MEKQDVLTPEQYEELLRLGTENQELAAAIAQQQALADSLRTNDFGQMRGNGRVQVASSPLEMLAGIGRNWKAGQMDKAIQGQQRTSIGNTQQQNQTVMRAILNGNNSGSSLPPSVAPFNPGAGGGDPYSSFRRGGSA